MGDKFAKLSEAVEKLKIGGYHRHVFLCVGGSCASDDAGREAWDELKKLLKDLNLSLSTGPNACFRTKVDCLRVCLSGPILVVYPEGTWYAGMTKDRIPRFVQEHLIGGKPVEEWIFARNPLPHDGPAPGG